MRIGSLFSGYGGLDLAVQRVLGGRVAWHADNDPAATAVLAHHWPDVPNHGDVTGIDWTGVEPVEVLTAGFPCQDVSLAGRRAGLAPGTRSGLWTHTAHAIHTLRPRLVVIENVRGLLSAPAATREMEPCPWCVGDRPGPVLRALGAILGDLADLGYDARWCGLRAADTGAPHARFRVFVLARARTAAADPHHLGRPRPRDPRQRWSRPADHDRATANTEGQRRHQGRPEPARQQRRPDAALGGGLDWGPYAAAIARWERRLGRPAPTPTQPGRRGGRRLAPRFVEWLMGLPEGHVTDVPGLTRADQLRLLGNGVVPQQAASALCLMQPERTSEEVAA
ncbi:DNA cytosine methyltransferase [Saccharopolyspora hordei]|uniref:DNA (cytosine-5-)-methyltransferase n=1 Tax=Saccharopolyspora hordei TaxID=1838 RepID=A0A853AUU4_9PSEU|nr:DNA cytosine methyltransferase [Saccharopolyspora hordei]NYI86425.1 DNA (cytosine-5)-methyltransferase 1 [Saccharopolyspora hordei]